VLQTSVGSVVSQLHHTVTDRSRELVTLACLLSFTFAMVSLLGWDPLDPTFFTSGFGAVSNPCGPVGANLAYLLFVAFGYGAWSAFFMMAVCFMVLARRPVGRSLDWVVGTAIFWVVLCVFDLLLPAEATGTYSPGGWIGAESVGLLHSVVGLAGTWLVLVGLLLTGLSLMSRVRWTELMTRMVDRLEGLIPRVGAMLGRLWQVILARLGRSVNASRLGASSIAGRLRSDAEVTGALFGRMRQALFRDASALDEEWASDPPVGHLPPSTVGSEFRAQPSDFGALALDERPPAGEVQWVPSTVGGVAEVLGLFPTFAHRRHAEESSAPRSVAVSPPPLTPSTPSVTVSAEVTAPMAQQQASAVARSQPKSPAEAPVENGDVEIHKEDFLERQVRDDGRAVARSKSRSWRPPELKLLDEVPEQTATFDPELLKTMARLVEERLASFKVTGRVKDVRVGPVVTTLEFLPDPGISVRKVANLSADLAMALKALSVRIVAPIPGRGVVGIEIPSPRRMTIYLRELLASPEFRKTDMALPCILGKSVDGRPSIADLARMPHLLVGGTTGSGKSVGVNGMLMSLLFTRTPQEMRLLLIDPKKLEFDAYADVPHLLHPIVTEPKMASAVLAWACTEMDRRYEVLRRWKVRNIAGYNEKVKREARSWTREKAEKYAPRDWTDEDLRRPETMPFIVVVIDELADLMMVAKKDVQDSIVRLAQMARACGIHLIIATQRPSVDVITGLIKSNLPTRIAYKLRSVIDSRTILDQGGAEHLLGMGDMLYLPGAGEVRRCHGAFVSDAEVERVADYLRAQAEPEYVSTISVTDTTSDMDLEDKDELYDRAVEIVITAGKASTSMVQRHLKIGYNRAARIIDLMESAGVIGPADGARPREVLVGQQDR
jgi:S-DNA-T family DNA segregation ATPase FtsK/SpoIIIE